MTTSLRAVYKAEMVFPNGRTVPPPPPVGHEGLHYTPFPCTRKPIIAPSKPTASPSTSAPDCPKSNTTTSAPGAPKHGLNKDEFQCISTLSEAKMKEFSEPEIIPDGLTIKKGSTVLATFCNKCGRFTKGATMHHGGIHEGRTWFKSSVPSLGSEAPVGTNFPVSANLGAVQLDAAQIDAKPTTSLSMSATYSVPNE